MQTRTEYRKVKNTDKLWIEPGDAKHLNIKMPTALYDSVRQIALNTGKSQTRVVYELLQFAVENYKEEKR